MSDRPAVRLRCLPDGPFLEGFELGWKGRLLELHVPGGELSLGALLEIECGSMLYFGELQQKNGPSATVSIEHSLDRAKLKAIQQAWG